MLAEGCAFWPAGAMTLRKPPQCVNYSVSPNDGRSALPIYGTASATMDEEVGATGIGEESPQPVVADREDLDEKKEGDVPGGVVEEEMRQPRVGRRPILPTKAEVDEHFPLHLQYRSWCWHCRAGKGRLAPHLVEPPEREKTWRYIQRRLRFHGLRRSRGRHAAESDHVR